MAVSASVRRLRGLQSHFSRKRSERQAELGELARDAAKAGLYENDGGYDQSVKIARTRKGSEPPKKLSVRNYGLERRTSIDVLFSSS